MHPTAEILSWWAQIGETFIALFALAAAFVALGYAYSQLRAGVEATTLSTLAHILASVQDDKVRQSRGYLLDNKNKLRQFPYEQWHEPHDKWQLSWIDAADRVCQSFNSAGLVSQISKSGSLRRDWIKPTRIPIVESWNLTRPRVKHRRERQSDLWTEFDWLAAQAYSYLTDDERQRLERDGFESRFPK